MRSGGLSQLKTHNLGSNIQLNTPPQSFFYTFVLIQKRIFPGGRPVASDITREK